MQKKICDMLYVSLNLKEKQFGIVAMNQQTAEKIASAASFLITSEALKHQEYLAQPYRLAIDILEVLRNGKQNHYTSSQISKYLETNTQIYREKGLNANTVCQVLQALRKGGIAIYSNRKLGWHFQIEAN